MKKLIAVLLLTMGLSAGAWEPTKPVTVIVGNTPGAGNESAFRKLAEIVQKKNPNFVSKLPASVIIVIGPGFPYFSKEAMYITLA